jgi:hypothetical protein
MFRAVLLGCSILAIIKLGRQTRGDVLASCVRAQAESCASRGGLHWGLLSRALAVLAVGSGLVGPRWALTGGPTGTALTLHPLFFAGLLGCVAFWLYRYRAGTYVMHQSDAVQVSRALTRRVYLLLFIMLAAREIVGLLRAMWLDPAAGDGAWRAYLTASAETVATEFQFEFRGYVILGVAVIVMVRLAAITLHSFGAGVGLRDRPDIAVTPRATATPLHTTRRLPTRAMLRPPETRSRSAR